MHEAMVALPHGYDTMLSRTIELDDDRSKQGMLLSGGQWQRMAIAREVLPAPKDLLILDEPSSGLDAEAERDLQLQLRAYRAGRTSVLISHRLGTLRDADIIVTLVDGQVEATGRHAELMAADGTYAALFRMQADGYASAPSASSTA
jgi:ATP-binding cassette subfamily B protein